MKILTEQKQYKEKEGGKWQRQVVVFSMNDIVSNTSEAKPITEFRDNEKTAHNRSDNSPGSMLEYKATWRVALACTTLINRVSVAITSKIVTRIYPSFPFVTVDDLIDQDREPLSTISSPAAVDGGFEKSQRK